MKNSTIIFFTTLAYSLFFTVSAQIPFSWFPNDTIETNLDVNSDTQLKIEQINASEDTLNLGIEIVYNNIPNAWDGMVCVYGICLGTIPAVGATAVMSPITGATRGYVRLTVNPLGGKQQATLRVRVYDVDNPSQGDTATWLLNSQPPTVGIEDFNSQFSFNIFPNPTQDYLTLEINNNEVIDAVQMINISGQKVLEIYRQDIANQKIDVSALKKGIYFLQIVHKGAVRESKKVLIQ